MPDSYEEWYKQQIDNGKLPDENGYFHYYLSEEEIEPEQGENTGASLLLHAGD